MPRISLSVPSWQRLASPAVSTEALELDLSAIDAEPRQAGPASVDLEILEVSVLEVHVPDSSAGVAHEVVVVLPIDLELYGATGTIQRTDDAGTDQLLEIAVHRGV